MLRFTGLGVELAMYSAFATWADQLASKFHNKELMNKVAARFIMGAIAASFERW